MFPSCFLHVSIMFPLGFPNVSLRLAFGFLHVSWMFPSCFLHVSFMFPWGFPYVSPYAFLRFPSCFYYVSVGGFVCFWDNCSNKSFLNKRNNNSIIFTTEYLSFYVSHRLEFKFIFISIFQVPQLILSGSAAYIYLSIYPFGVSVRPQ